MMKVLKKIGSILFCLLPVLLALGIQLLVVAAGFAIKIFILVSQDPSQISEIASPDFIYPLLGDSQFLMLLSAIYGVIAALALGFWYWKRFFHRKPARTRGLPSDEPHGHPAMEAGDIHSKPSGRTYGHPAMETGAFRSRQPRRTLSSIIHPAMFLGLIFLMVGMQYISTYLIAVLAAVNPAWYHSYEELMESAGFGNVTFVLVLYSVIIAPISEELIFRGVTMKYAAKAMPFFLANIFQAFLFGLFHGNVVQGTYAFVVGLFCGYVCFKGGSIYLSILFHMMFNLWGTFAADFFSYTGDSVLIHLAIFAGAVLAAAAGMLLYQRGIKRRSA